jgi:Ca-activated chloride channel homolog
VKVLLLASRSNRILEKALRAVPDVEVSVSTNLTQLATGFDLVVLDDTVPAVWPTGNILALHVQQANWFDQVGAVQGPSIVHWRIAHPLLQHAGLDDVHVRESFVAKTPSWAVSLADSPQGSLVLAGELGRQRIIWIGFDTLESDWPLRVSFPIFIANAVEWLTRFSL